MLSSEQILAVSRNVIDTMVGAESLESDLSFLQTNRDQVTGCIQITGEWTGAVVVEASHQFAVKASCSLFALEESTVTEQDLEDSLAELTNMIGGNIKGIVPGPSFLSLPSTSIGFDVDFRVFGAELTHIVTLDCCGTAIQIRIYYGALPAFQTSGKYSPVKLARPVAV